LRLTKRGKIIAGVGILAAGVVALSTILALAGKNPPVIGPIGHAITGKKGEPTTCPLTDLPRKHVPNRPALALKVENLPEARPQAGLNGADIVYEEPVEGGITRFIAVYQCQDAARVGPVRSARFTDVPVLKQYDRPLFGFAGAAPPVVAAVDHSGVRDLNFNIAVDAYYRDPNRSEPHNLYTSTKALYKASAGARGAPDPVFSYDADPPDHAKKATIAHLDFSASSDVYWHWNAKRGVWLRSHGDVPHMLEGDVQVYAKNVVVQVVRIKMTGIHDAAGNFSPEAITVGSGKAYVFRSGHMIVGRWLRESGDDVTKFVTKSGDTISLAPGKTWVELYPSNDPAVATR
jgi:hypothetical protein